MADYRKMYFKMLTASEEAINSIIEAQKECEELFLSDHAPRLTPSPRRDSSAPQKK